jgi:pyruvate/2-oxoglutarate dehydrogenase complex dihydrolipoamide dehydrogenase (E3) component
MKIGIVGSGVRAIQIAQALQMLEVGIEIVDKPLELHIHACEDIDYPATAKLCRDNEPWRKKHKRNKGVYY